MPSNCHLSLPFAAKNLFFNFSMDVTVPVYSEKASRKSVVSCFLSVHVWEKLITCLQRDLRVRRSSNIVYSYKLFYNFKIICLCVREKIIQSYNLQDYNTVTAILQNYILKKVHKWIVSSVCVFLFYLFFGTSSIFWIVYCVSTESYHVSTILL